MNEFKDLKENNLIKNNFKQDNQNFYLKTLDICYEEHTHCEKCNCGKWITDNETGKPFLCDCSSNKHTDLEKKSLAWTNGSIFTEKFSNFTKDNPVNEKNLKIVKNFCENVGKPGKPTHLFLFGNVGTGKSHLLKGSVNFFILNNRSGKYFIYPEFKNEIQNFDENVQLKKKQFFEYPILIIDEMYMNDKQAGYSRENFNDILITRWERKRPTLVAGNINPKQLSPPVQSRFFDDSITTRIDTWLLGDKRLNQKAF